MITKFSCVNITSKDPKALAEFYRTIGAPVCVEDNCYDGWFLGTPDHGGTICVWDENTWGKSTAGFITIVLDSDDVEATYNELLQKGFDIAPPKTADWGGKELTFKDPDGNIIMVL